MITAIADFVLEGTERGVALILRDQQQRFLYFLAGTRHGCPAGELFYGGIGGHLETNEGWISCAQREAREEIGSEIDILESPVSWYLPSDGPIQRIAIGDRPQPFALYDYIHPAGTPQAGGVYKIVLYQAVLLGKTCNFPVDELQGILALTQQQVVISLERRPTLAELLEEGAGLLETENRLDRQTRVYPIGSAVAVAQILQLDDRT